VSCLATGGASADTVRLSTTVAETSNWVKGAQRFKELVEERSDGRHTVEIYPSGVLVGGNDRVELEMAQAGAVDMIMKSTPWLGQLDDDFMVIGMPWIFPDADAAMAVMDGPVGERLAAILEGAGIRRSPGARAASSSCKATPGRSRRLPTSPGSRSAPPGSSCTSIPGRRSARCRWR
jgi:TRAP-type C4-dicarboxylate transport system substrate-binding protein